MKTVCNKVFLLAVMLCGFAFSFERITNYASCISVYDFESDGDSLYVASSGGLYVFNKSTKTGRLLPSNTRSPDPCTKSLCLQGNQILWSGTNQGYLSKRTPPDNLNLITTFPSYFSTQWKILDLVLYGKYLLIASNKGISVFNTEKGYAVKSASKFGSLPSSQVNVIKIYNDILYAGLDQGIAELSLKAGLEGAKKAGLEDANFFDPSIWNVATETVKPVKSFVYKNGPKAYSGYADIFNGQIISSEDSSLFLDSVKIQKLPSRITALKVTGNNECWIGTEENYFYLWNGTALTPFNIPGPTMSPISKVFVDHNSKLWYLPRIIGSNAPWWVGVGSFENDNWRIYNTQRYSNMGPLGENADHQGIMETKDNRMWFGTSGGQVKAYSSSNDSWKIYNVNPLVSGGFFSSDNNSEFGKTDAIAIDSSNYLWLSTWDDVNGSLICYNYRFEPDPSQSDPEAAHYRRFFPQHPTFSKIFSCINVNKTGQIIAGDIDGKVVVFKHNGNPLLYGIEIVKSFVIQNARIHDAITLSDNLTRLITSDGLYVYDPSNNTIVKNEDFINSINCIEAENDHVLWIGTYGNGLIRYDITTNQQSVISTAQGLISNEISDISFDRKNGFLWIATDFGFSKLDLGYSLDKNLKAGDVEVFPNPYSKSKMAQISITIRNVPAGGKVAVYNVNGQLIARPKLERQGNGSFYSWKPESALIPGNYIIAIKSSNQSGSKVLLISP